MRIPKIISKDEHEYVFEKQINEKLFLYRDMIYGYKECFSSFDLGLVKEVAPGTKKMKKDRKYGW